MKILIVKLSAIGDVIHTLPALNALRKRFPGAHITWLVEKAAAELIDGHPALDRIIVSNRKQWLKGLRTADALNHSRNILHFIRKLRDTHYDLIIDFQGLLKSGALVGLARGTRKIGFGRGMQRDEGAYLFLNECVPAADMNRHALERNLLLLRALGIVTNDIEYHIPTGQDEQAAVADLLEKYGLDAHRRLVAVNPSTRWESKLWRRDRFAELADRIIDDFDAAVVFTGSAADRDLLASIITAMKHTAVNLAGRTTLKELTVLYTKCALAVTTDTGPMHLAVAAGTPVVALFGPTAPWRTGPYGAVHKVVRTELKCSPCFKRQCPTRICMEQISVDQVMTAIHEQGLEQR
jgi:3-deoxy-D-manno-octulosonic-acid transferase/heptosyltransferase-1